MKRRNALILTYLASVSTAAPAGLVDWFTNVKIGMALPDFDAEYLTAEPVNDRKLLLIDFWATWCAPCRAEFPHLNILSETFSNSGLEVVGLTQEPKAVAVAFLPKVDIRYKIGAGGAKPLQKTLGIKPLPYALMANRQRKIVWRGQSSDLTKPDIEHMLKSAA